MRDVRCGARYWVGRGLLAVLWLDDPSTQGSSMTSLADFNILSDGGDDPGLAGVSGSTPEFGLGETLSDR